MQMGASLLIYRGKRLTCLKPQSGNLVIVTARHMLHQQEGNFTMSASKNTSTTSQQHAGQGVGQGVGQGTAQEAGTAGVESLTRTAQEGFAKAMEVPKKVMEANLDTGAELLTFMSRRLKAQADLFNGVGHCHDATEAADMQRTFWTKVTKDYSEEMDHLAEIARKNFATVSGLMSPKSNGDTKQKSVM
jgi:hypothetical protein